MHTEGGVASTDISYYTLNTSGLKAYGGSRTTADGTVQTIVPSPPVILTPATVSDGQVINWTGITFTMSTHVPNGTTQTTQATDGGANTINGTERVDLPDGRSFPDALKITTVETVAISIPGGGTLTRYSTEVQWLVKGVGAVRRQDHQVSTSGTQDTDDKAEDLTSCSLLPTFATLNNGTLTITGTPASDQISVSSANGIVTASLNGQIATFNAAMVQRANIAASWGSNLVDCRTLIIPCSIYGGDGDDTLCGGYGNDFIDASSGDDVVYACAGDDVVTAYDGNDTVFAGAGNDIVYGGSGNDALRGEDGNDTLSGEGGDDRLYGDKGYDVVYGGDGADRMDGGTGNDTLWGGRNQDYMTGMAGNDDLIGEDGKDTLLGGDNNDYLDGGTGGDSLDGGAGDDVIMAIDAASYTDTVIGGGGNDTAHVNQMLDVVSGVGTLLYA